MLIMQLNDLNGVDDDTRGREHLHADGGGLGRA